MTDPSDLEYIGLEVGEVAPPYIMRGETRGHLVRIRTAGGSVLEGVVDWPTSEVVERLERLEREGPDWVRAVVAFPLQVGAPCYRSTGAHPMTTGE